MNGGGTGTNGVQRVDPQSFDQMYREDDDPWRFASSPYEREKYRTTIESLGSARYARCFEPACSIGVLTALLADRADEVVACDASTRAISKAKTRLADATNVQWVTAPIPEWWPSGSFDLIVLSELGYYWDREGWGSVIERCRASLRTPGEIIAVHWLGSSNDHVLDGATVHRELGARLGPSQLHIEREEFVLDRWGSVSRG